MRYAILFSLAFLFAAPVAVQGQQPTSETFQALALRNLGGAIVSGRISDVAVDPRNSDVVYAAAQGPLWASGGERGLYKTSDGGESWERSLYVSENTGIADIVFDPQNPDIIYASSYQRRRHVGILIAGGPEGTIYKTTDAGATWREVDNGLPEADMGRIALEVSPHYAGVVYATVASQDEESGIFRSDDYGESWTKVSDYHPNDPQYYGELFADPHRPGRVCAVDTNLHCTIDNGVTWEPFRLQGVHVDHHEIVFDPVDPDYMLLGNDGGLYESFDAGQRWRHFANLPVAQPYRVGISNEEPFYWVFGGTQDNGTPGRRLPASGGPRAPQRGLRHVSGRPHLPGGHEGGRIRKHRSAQRGRSWGYGPLALGHSPGHQPLRVDPHLRLGEPAGPE